MVGNAERNLDDYAMHLMPGTRVRIRDTQSTGTVLGMLFLEIPIYRVRWDETGRTSLVLESMIEIKL